MAKAIAKYYDDLFWKWLIQIIVIRYAYLPLCSHLLSCFFLLTVVFHLTVNVTSRVALLPFRILYVGYFLLPFTSLICINVLYYCIRHSFGTLPFFIQFIRLNICLSQRFFKVKRCWRVWILMHVISTKISSICLHTTHRSPLPSTTFLSFCRSITPSHTYTLT